MLCRIHTWFANRLQLWIYLGALIICLHLFYRDPPTTSEALAAWVQAFGSIAAIFFAGLLATRQVRLEDARAANQRAELVDCLRILAARAVALAEEAERILVSNSDPASYFDGRASYSARDFREAEAALRAIPFHEIPPAALVSLLKIADAIRDVAIEASIAEGEWRAGKFLHPETAAALAEFAADVYAGNRALREAASPR